MTEYKSLDTFREQIEKEPGKLFERDYGFRDEIGEEPCICKIYFRDKNGYWHGTSPSGTPITQSGNMQQWKPHVPAPPKVKRWRWLVVPAKDSAETDWPLETNLYFPNEESVKRHFSHYAREGATFHRLDETERDFDY